MFIAWLLINIVFYMEIVAKNSQSSSWCPTRSCQENFVKGQILGADFRASSCLELLGRHTPEFKQQMQSKGQNTVTVKTKK